MTQNTKTIGNLSLYHYQACPFCAYTRQFIKSGGAPKQHSIELRNIQQDKQHRKALISGGGKQQVPCLRIDYTDGKTKWLYESGDIVAYLKKLSKAA